MEEPDRNYGEDERRSREAEGSPKEMVAGDYEGVTSWESTEVPQDRANEYGRRVRDYIEDAKSEGIPRRTDLSMGGREWSEPWRPAFMPRKMSESGPGGEVTGTADYGASKSGEEAVDGERRDDDKRGNLGKWLVGTTALAVTMIYLATVSGGGKDNGPGKDKAKAVVPGAAQADTIKDNAPASTMVDGLELQSGATIRGTEPGEEVIEVKAPVEEAVEVPRAEEAVLYKIDDEVNDEVRETGDENTGNIITLEEVRIPEAEVERTAKYEVVGQKNISGLGVIERYKYSGGYIRENDPYYVDFEDKSTQDSFGAPLEGATPAERVQDLTKRWAASPKELVTMISHMNLESKMGLAEFKSMDEENAFADKLAGYDSEKYDEFVNRFYTLFYGRVEGAKISKNCIMARDMMDRTGDPSDGEQSEIVLFGRLRGNEGAAQVTFYDKNGKNVISDKEAFNHEFATMSETERNKARQNNVSSTAWINIGEEGGEEGRAGNIEYKAGKKVEKTTEKPTQKPTPVPTEKPTEKPTQKPTPVPTEKPTEKPTQKPTPVPTEKPTQKPTPVPTEKPTPVVTPEPKPTKNPEAVSKPIEEVKKNENVVINNNSGSNPSNENPSGRPESIGERTVQEKPASQEELANDLADLGL